MIQVGRDDLLKALKKFKGIAKQDVLLSDLTSYPQYWKAHAEARRMEYATLIGLVEEAGVEKACAYAFSTYNNLPGVSDGDQTFAEIKGREQAIEVFFQVVGVDIEHLKTAKYNHEDSGSFFVNEPQINYEYYHSS